MLNLGSDASVEVTLLSRPGERLAYDIGTIRTDNKGLDSTIPMRIDCADQGVFIRDGHFENNRASRGGALGTHDRRKGALFDISSSTFVGNTAALHGGAAFVSGSQSGLLLDLVNFVHNVVTSPTGSGGAIAVEDNAGLRYTNGIADGNVAGIIDTGASAGGFLCGRFADALLLKNITITTSSAEGGGALAVFGSNIALAAVHIEQCMAGSRGGGALLLDAGSSGHLLGGCTFANNTASDVSSGFGGHVTVGASVLVAHGNETKLTWPASPPQFPYPVDLGFATTIVEENSPGTGSWGGLCRCSDGTTYGAGDRNNGCGSLACYGDGKSGGCFEAWDEFWAHQSVTCGTAVPARATLFSQGAAQQGGAIFCASSLSANAGVPPLYATAGLAAEAGCASQVYEIRDPTLSPDSQYACWDKGIHLGPGTVVQDSLSGIDGGGVFASGCDVSVRGVTFSQNTADLNGGGITVAEGSSLYAVDSNFTQNRAQRQGGGAVECYLCNMTLVQDTVFVGNSASARGGAVLIESPYQLTGVVNSTFIANTAGSGGGAVSLSDSLHVGSFYSVGSTFVQNTAESGSGGA